MWVTGVQTCALPIWRRVWLYGASPFDSLDAELADVVAERLVVVDLIGGLSIDGDERRAAAGR